MNLSPASFLRLAAAAVCVAFTSLAAAPLTFTATGRVVLLSNPFTNTIAVGNAVTYTFTYDPTTAPTVANGFLRQIPFQSASLNIAGTPAWSATTSTDLRFTVQNNTGTTADKIIASSTPSNGPVIPGSGNQAGRTFTPITMGIELYAPATFLTTNEIPTALTLSNFNPYALVEGSNVYVQFQSSDNSIVTIRAQIDTLSAAGGGTASTPQSQAVAAGVAASLTTAATGAIQWQRNGANVAGATSGTLTLASVQPADTGIYTAAVTASGATTLQHAIVGVTSTAKVIGSGSEVGANIPHQNGNIYDQLLLEGAAAAFTADSSLNQITRLSFIDLSNDIVQVEFSGPGTVSIVLDGSSGPAAPVNYNQTVTYMKGHAGIVVVGATENTHLSIFSVGRVNAVNQALFKDNVTYDGVADLAFVAIASSNGKFGGLRTANASYWNTKGLTGVYAPGVQFTGPVYVNDINASDSATPVLMIGSGSDTRVAGGDLLQTNGRAVQVTGLTQLKFTAGSTSHGGTLAAQANKGRLEQNGADVTAQVVVNP